MSRQNSGAMTLAKSVELSNGPPLHESPGVFTAVVDTILPGGYHGLTMEMFSESPHYAHGKTLVRAVRDRKDIQSSTARETVIFITRIRYHIS